MPSYIPYYPGYQPIGPPIQAAIDNPHPQRVRFGGEPTTYRIHPSNAPNDVLSHADMEPPSTPTLPPRSLPGTPEPALPVLPLEPPPCAYTRAHARTHASASAPASSGSDSDGNGGAAAGYGTGALGLDSSRTAAGPADGAYPHTRTHAQSGHSAHRTRSGADADHARGAPSSTGAACRGSRRSSPNAPPSPASSFGSDCAAETAAAPPGSDLANDLREFPAHFDVRTSRGPQVLVPSLLNRYAFASGRKTATLRFEPPTGDADAWEAELSNVAQGGSGEPLTIGDAVRFVHAQLYQVDEGCCVFYDDARVRAARAHLAERRHGDTDRSAGVLRLVDLYPQNASRFYGLAEVPGTAGQGCPVYRVIIHA